MKYNKKLLLICVGLVTLCATSVFAHAGHDHHDHAHHDHARSIAFWGNRRPLRLEAVLRKMILLPAIPAGNCCIVTSFVTSRRREELLLPVPKEQGDLQNESHIPWLSSLPDPFEKSEYCLP